MTLVKTTLISALLATAAAAPAFADGHADGKMMKTDAAMQMDASMKADMKMMKKNERVFMLPAGTTVMDGKAMFSDGTSMMVPTGAELVHDGRLVKLPKGTTVMSTGEVTLASGTTVMLPNGAKFYKDGQLMKMWDGKSKMVDTAAWTDKMSKTSDKTMMKADKAMKADMKMLMDNERTFMLPAGTTVMDGKAMFSDGTSMMVPASAKLVHDGRLVKLPKDAMISNSGQVTLASGDTMMLPNGAKFAKNGQMMKVWDGQVKMIDATARMKSDTMVKTRTMTNTEVMSGTTTAAGMKINDTVGEVLQADGEPDTQMDEDIVVGGEGTVNVNRFESMDSDGMTADNAIIVPSPTSAAVTTVACPAGTTAQPDMTCLVTGNFNPK